jgi:CDP-paratose 2-epimerase
VTSRLLVTGGCGFLGSNLAVAAVQRGWQVALLDNLGRVGASDNLPYVQAVGEVQFRQGDIRDVAIVSELVQSFKPDVVFHLAGQVAMTASIERPLEDFDINAGGTLKLFEAMRQYCPTATIIYSSTNKVYGDVDICDYQETDTRYIANGFGRGFDESTPLDFHSPYGRSKGAADQYLLDLHRIYGLNTCVFRHSSMYGGRQYATFDQGWVGWFCQQALLQQRGEVDSTTIAGNGKWVGSRRWMLALALSACSNGARKSWFSPGRVGVA